MAAPRRIALMALLELRRAYGTLRGFAGLVVLPILAAFALVALFSASGSTVAPVVLVVDEDGGAQAAAYLEALALVPFDVRTATREEALIAVADGERALAVVVPVGFGAVADGPAEDAFGLELLVPEGVDPAVARAAAAWPRAVAARLATGAPPAGPVFARTSPSDAGDPAFFVATRLAFVAFVVFALVLLIGRGAAFHRERASGRLARTVVTGVPMREVVAAHVVSLLGVGTVQAVAFFGATALLGIPWFAAGAAPLVVAVGATLIAAAGLASAVTGFARTVAQVQVWSYGAPSLFAMLGGAWWPLDTAPGVMQQAARLSPVFWSLEAFEGGAIYAGWATQVVPVAVLVGVGVLGFVAGVQALRRVEV